METRRRSSRLQQQTTSDLNAREEPQPSEPPVKRARGAKKNEAPSTAPMPPKTTKKSTKPSRKQGSPIEAELDEMGFELENEEEAEIVVQKSKKNGRKLVKIDENLRISAENGSKSSNFLEENRMEIDEKPGNLAKKSSKNGSRVVKSDEKSENLVQSVPKSTTNGSKVAIIEDDPEIRAENGVKSSKSDEKPDFSAQNGSKLAQNAPNRISRPRRSVTTAKKVSYVPSDDQLELSSSSSELESSSEDEDTEIRPKTGSKIAKKREKSFKISESESSSESPDDESEASEASEDPSIPGPSEPRKRRKIQRKSTLSSGGATTKDLHWPKCSKASIARKTGNPGSKNAAKKPAKSSLRMAQKQKPDQPWKKNLKDYETDRKLAKGERRMLEYRHVAHAYVARGKIEEITYDEAYKLHEMMKKAYFAGRSLLDAAVLDPVEFEKSQKNVKKSEKNDEKNTAGDSSSSEDEWEEMEHFQPPIIDDNIEVSIDHEGGGGDDGEEVVKDWWAIYLRQEINRKIREMWENTHKVHLLCFMAHLKFVVKIALDESLVPSLMMSQLPNGYLKFIGEPVVPIDIMKNLVKWFADAFRPLNGVVSVASIEQDSLLEGHEARYPETRRLTALVDAKCFETDLDRATLLFCLLRGLELTTRLVVNVRAIPRRWDKTQQKELQNELSKFRELSRSRSTTPGEKSLEIQEKSGEKSQKPAKKGQKSEKKAAKKVVVEERNYWVEYWQPREKRWICVDPLHKSVDEPLSIHEHSASPISYVFAIDNKQGICEVSQRYAMDCVKQDFRRRRTNPKWVAWTLFLPPFAANSERKKWEMMQMREDLVKRPLPTVMSEYKNHPLYALEKDLLKFEAIYPPPATQKPLGQIRGHNVYPRSTVFTLQGENNWLKLARSVKIGEKPYKIVKARPDPRIPVEDREDKFLDVYGYWQTEKYRRPPLKNGKIPHNEYGNVYMFNENMCPLDCTYLKLSGLVQISRKLGKQCIPAVVGWAFDGGFTHPVIDGAIVLEKDAIDFINAWEKLESGRAEKEEKQRVEKIHENWKKLIKGMLRLAYVRKQFGHPAAEKPTKRQKIGGKTEEIEENEGGAGPPSSVDHITDNTEQITPMHGFSLDDFINKKK